VSVVAKMRYGKVSFVKTKSRTPRHDAARQTSWRNLHEASTRGMAWTHQGRGSRRAYDAFPASEVKELYTLRP